MKLLLTSNGVTNDSIATALFKLVGKAARDTSIAFVPTAVLAATGDKSWFVNDLYNLKKLGLKHLDIVEISSVPKEVWLPKMRAADVLFFSGGNTAFLMYWINKSGLGELLNDLLSTRVYAGISAGSIIASPTIVMSSKKTLPFFAPDELQFFNEKGLGLVKFYLRPHLNSPHQPVSAENYLREKALQVPGVIYGIDDQTAVSVIDGVVEIVTEGNYIILNKK